MGPPFDATTTAPSTSTGTYTDPSYSTARTARSSDPALSGGREGAEQDTSDDEEGLLFHHRQRQPLLPHGAGERKGGMHKQSASDGGGTNYAAGGGGGKRKPYSGYHDGGPAAFLHTTMNEAVKTVNELVKIQMPLPHRDEPRFPREIGKTLLVVVFMFTCAFITDLAQTFTMEQRASGPPLQDIVLDTFPMHPWGLVPCETIIMIAMGVCGLLFIFHKHRLIILRRVFFLLGLVYLYRSITFPVTILPESNPSVVCVPKLNTTHPWPILQRAFIVFSGFGLQINGANYCTDYIFSGHTCMLTLAYLVLSEYSPRRWWILHWLFGAFCFTGVVMLLLGRGHYTVDIIIAYFVITRLWLMYHTMCNNQSLKERTPTNHIARVWWFPLFLYLEGNVGGVVPRHFEWPLPWPRRWGTKNPQRIS